VSFGPLFSQSHFPTPLKEHPKNLHSKFYSTLRSPGKSLGKTSPLCALSSGSPLLFSPILLMPPSLSSIIRTIAAELVKVGSDPLPTFHTHFDQRIPSQPTMSFPSSWRGRPARKPVLPMSSVLACRAKSRHFDAHGQPLLLATRQVRRERCQKSLLGESVADCAEKAPRQGQVIAALVPCRNSRI
jgi:hypothetical protein